MARRHSAETFVFSHEAQAELRDIFGADTSSLISPLQTCVGAHLQGASRPRRAPEAIARELIPLIRALRAVIHRADQIPPPVRRRLMTDGSLGEILGITSPWEHVVRVCEHAAMALALCRSRLTAAQADKAAQSTGIAGASRLSSRQHSRYAASP